MKSFRPDKSPHGRRRRQAAILCIVIGLLSAAAVAGVIYWVHYGARWRF